MVGIKDQNTRPAVGWMKEEYIGNEEVIATIKKMALEKGVKKEELEAFLEKHAFQFGSLNLLRNLVGADFQLKAAENTYKYMPTKNLALEMLDKPFESGEKALSIGCSTGVTEANLARKGCLVWGLDTKEKMITIASKLAEEMHLSENCRFLVVDGYEYPFSDEFFDSVLYSHSLHEIEDKAATLQESFRVLKSQGRVIVLEDETGKEGVMDAITDSRFEIEEEKVVLPYKVFNHGMVTSVFAIVLEKKRP
ncbi:MAG: class I SAM-dependent methyltransferase [Methanomassiliicoccales archaeon]|nr:MAG: class I SAM-dependent methyltransferase [Methanomassiliicoccales archaeon]